MWTCTCGLYRGLFFPAIFLKLFTILYSLRKSHSQLARFHVPTSGMGNSEVFKRIYTAVATSIAAAPILISNSILNVNRTQEKWLLQDWVGTYKMNLQYLSVSESKFFRNYSDLLKRNRSQLKMTANCQTWEILSNRIYNDINLSLMRHSGILYKT